MPTKHVPIYEVQVGMYVAKLDLSWLRSPFLRHSFLIEEPAQIEKLVRAGVKSVEIDLRRGIDVPTGTEPMGATTSLDRTQFPLRVPVTPVKSLAQLNEEYARAQQARDQLERSVSTLFSAFAKGTANTRHATEAVREITIVTRTIANSAIFLALSLNRTGDLTLTQHALTTCTLSLVAGQACGLNPLELLELGTAALLHDVGLLQIPSHIIQRAHTTSPPLSVNELRQFHTHPRLSILILERTGGFDTPILHLIGDHHGYLDGSGCPRNTGAAFASQRTRILMMTDKYDELITGFGGASPLAPHQALQRLYQEAQEGHFDQHILSHFIKIVGIYPVHSQVRLNTKEMAIVTKLNPDILHRPIITITHGPDGAAYPIPLIVDLARQDNQAGERIIDAVLPPVPAHASQAAERRGR